MSTRLVILRAGPLATIQDRGRFGMLRHGIGESGPMDARAFAEAAAVLAKAGTAGIEFTQAGLGFEIAGGGVTAGFAGGVFNLAVNGRKQAWPKMVKLKSGDRVEVTPGAAGNYGYVRLDREIGIEPILGSRATNCTVGLGGLGRPLRAGDEIALVATKAVPELVAKRRNEDGPIRVVWGLHAELFPTETRQRFLSEGFRVSGRLDRMGVRLEDPERVLAEARILSLVSDAVVAGDIQILGDGTPIVLMRDHQPTGGYPRIATIVAADLDRFAQMRPGSEIRFRSISPQHAYAERQR